MAVPREMFVAHAMKRAEQAALEQAENIFNVIGRVRALPVGEAVIDRDVLSGEAVFQRKRVSGMFARIDLRYPRADVLFQSGLNRTARCIRNVNQSHAPAALQHAKHYGLFLARLPPVAFANRPGADIGFVNFGHSAQLVAIFHHCAADTVCQMPRRAVALESQVTLHLHRRNSLFRMDDQRDGHEPRFQRQFCVGKYRAYQRGKLLVAFLFQALKQTAHGARFSSRVESGDANASTVDAARAVRPTRVNQEFVAGVFVWQGLYYV
jgi:hypothetical protein